MPNHCGDPSFVTYQDLSSDVKNGAFSTKKNHRIHVEPQFQLHGHIGLASTFWNEKLGMIKKYWSIHGMVLYCTVQLFMAEILHQLEGISCIRRDQRVPILVTGPRQSWVVGKNSGHFGQMGSSDSEAEGDLCWNSKETKQASNSKETNRFWLLGGFDFRCLICDSWMNQWEGLSR